MERCNLCKHEQPARLFIKMGFELVKCLKCGLVYVENPPKGAEIRKFYDESYYTGGNPLVYDDYTAQGESRVAAFGEKVRLLQTYIPGGKLLDVGCAAGFFLEAAKSRYDVCGVEHSGYSSGYARDILGHVVFTGDIGDAKYGASTFDCVTLWDVIEHFQDPRGVLDEIHRITKPGGIIALTTADVESMTAKVHGSKWIVVAPPWHLFYFSKPTITRMLEESGFEVIEIRRSGVPLINENVATSVSSKLCVALFGNRVAVRLAKVFNWGFIMTVIARRS